MIGGRGGKGGKIMGGESHQILTRRWFSYVIALEHAGGGLSCPCRMFLVWTVGGMVMSEEVGCNIFVPYVLLQQI
jgi:hypothetical protein